jgi:hypothetical protein
MLLRVWIALLALAVAAMPVSGAHLHLCFDGGEARATVHASDDGPHHADTTGASGVHHDADVSLAGPAVAKKFDGALELPSLIAAAFVIFRLALPSSVAVPRERAVPIATSSVLRLLPPLRGPPL